MIKSGQIFNHINGQIAILRTEIIQAGKLGNFDIHKQCENLVKQLLNLTYNYKLTNLNQSIFNFPGLDIGDLSAGIAYQVTSEKNSTKVDDTLNKVLRFKHYNNFPDIRIFILTSKQAKYSLNETFRGFFQFDPLTQIIDFDDLLRDIQQLPLNELILIKEFLDDELTYTINSLKGASKSDTSTTPTLLNIEASLQQSGMLYYQHSSIRVRLLGKSFSAPVLFKNLTKFYDGNKKQNLYLFNDAFRSNPTAQQVDFRQKLTQGNAINYFSEGCLRISANQISTEIASYSSEQALSTMLIFETYAIQSLLMFCNLLYNGQAMQVEIDFDLATNAKLYFFKQNSPLHINNYSASPILNPSPLSFSRVIHDVDDHTLNSIFTDLIHGFVTEAGFGNFFAPFLELNELEQNKSNDWFRKNFNIPLSK